MLVVTEPQRTGSSAPLASTQRSIVFQLAAFRFPGPQHSCLYSLPLTALIGFVFYASCFQGEQTL